MYSQEVLGSKGRDVCMENIEPKDAKQKERKKPIKREGKADVTRYNLSLPSPLMESLQKMADDECTTVLEIIRKFIKLGIILIESQKNGGKVILEQGGEKMILAVI